MYESISFDRFEHWLIIITRKQYKYKDEKGHIL